jgi:chorismate mutase
MNVRTLLLRGIRGATTVAANDAESILNGTEELLREIVRQNEIEIDGIASALFTLTPDLTAVFPAAAARRIGWTLVPLLNFTEIGVPGGLPRCVRVLIHVNTERTQSEIVHVYLHEAHVLRPDLKRKEDETT